MLLYNNIYFIKNTVDNTNASDRIWSVLDLMEKVKHYDGKLTYRRSCREGICGSCAMNINGKNTLACIRLIGNESTICIKPLANQRVLKSMVTDLSLFYSHLKLITPLIHINSTGSSSYTTNLDSNHNDSNHNDSNHNDTVLLDSNHNDSNHNDSNHNDSNHNDSNHNDSNRNLNNDSNRNLNISELLRGSNNCILCGCCSTSCPSYWWNSTSYVGPAVLLQAFRWIRDKRCNFGLKEQVNLYRAINGSLRNCHNIKNCTTSCPKKLEPSLGIRVLNGLFI